MNISEQYAIRVMAQLIDAIAKGGVVKSYGTMHKPNGYEFSVEIEYANEPWEKQPSRVDMRKFEKRKGRRMKEAT